MAKSKEREAQLKKNIENNTALKSKYERVRKSIESHNLHFSNEFNHINAFIEIAKDTLSKIDGNVGFGYFSYFRLNFASEIKRLEEYGHHVQQSSSSFKRMYETLETYITSLDILITNDKNELKAK